MMDLDPKRHALYINLKKCKFFANEVDFLGFIVKRDSIWMDPEKVESVASWPTPKNILEVQAFLGFINFYH